MNIQNPVSKTEKSGDGHKSLRHRIRMHAITKVILHPAITLVSLLILFVLIFFGTLYQADHGLYEAQRKFFGYGGVLVGGFFPLPAASLVLWVMCIQLTVTMLFVIPLKWSKFGLWVVHVGIATLLVGGFITQMMSTESQLTLAEGETGHFSTAYHDWELAFWEEDGDTNRVVAFDDYALKPGETFDLKPYQARFKINAYYQNCAAFTTRATGGPQFLNASNIGMIEQRKPEKEVTENAPGLTMTLNEKDKPAREILLFGQELHPLTLTLNGKKVLMSLRLKHYPLNFSLKLTDFIKNVHPGTDMASSFESYADMTEGTNTRPVKIWMNNPLRHNGFTFFQASFAQAPGMVDKSTFAVVTNPGRVLPYISSLIVFGGLLLHFLIKLIPFVRKETAR
jgi:ResB-like family